MCRFTFPITLQLLEHGDYNIYIFELNAGAFILLERLKTRQAVANKANHHVHVKFQEARACESVVKLYPKLIQNIERVQTECAFNFKAYNVQMLLFSMH